MSAANKESSQPKARASRASQKWIIPLVALLAVAGWAVMRDAPADGTLIGTQPTTTVQRGPLTISVIESGTLRPRQQVVLRNEMDEDSTIIFIVEEGKRVKKDDLIVELDASVWESDLVERRIRVENDQAALINAQENLKVVTNQAAADIEQAELDFRFAQLDLKKYENGEFPRQVKQLETSITLAAEELSRAEEQLRWSKILFEEKYLAQTDLQQDELAAKKAELNLELAKVDLEVFTDYTHVRSLDEFSSNVKQMEMALERTRRRAVASIAQANAELRRAEAEFEEEKDRLAWVEGEVAKARITAPLDGMVLYASSVSRRWDSDDGRIEVGTSVPERREIIYLPTADSYNADISVPEVNLNKLEVGQSATMRVDAIAGQVFKGNVASISPVADARSQWMNPNLKQYDVSVEMDPSEATFRNGMSCRVEIVVERYSNTLFLPVQSVVEHQGRTVVYRVEEEHVVPVPVEIGLDNNLFVRVISGVEEGDTILMTPPLSESREEDSSGEEDLEELEEIEPPDRETEVDSLTDSDREGLSAVLPSGGSAGGRG
jgi:HlyD family secretion protein